MLLVIIWDLGFPANAFATEKGFSFEFQCFKIQINLLIKASFRTFVKRKTPHFEAKI